MVEHIGTVGYWLVHTQRYLARALFSTLHAHCLALGKTYTVTPSQWLLLRLLIDEDGQTIGTLAQQIGVDAPAITAMVGRMEENRLVLRFRERNDQRVVRVNLTDEGKELANSLIPVVASFNEKIMGAEDRQAFIRQLQRIIETITSTFPEGGDKLGWPAGSIVVDRRQTDG
jgi:DNA-binding MarR family transcriptional regulator